MMDRLTDKRLATCGYYVPKNKDERRELQASCPSYRELYVRLAAYEDTGLTPEICAEYKKFEDEAVSKNVPFSRIVELMNAESEGRLIVPPCKVGDTVWSGEPFTDKKIREGTIVEINIDAYGFCGFWVSFHPSAIAAEFIKEDIGRTVFLTREEAEAALAKEAHNGE